MSKLHIGRCDCKNLTVQCKLQLLLKIYYYRLVNDGFHSYEFSANLKKVKMKIREIKKVYDSQ